MSKRITVATGVRYHPSSNTYSVQAAIGRQTSYLGRFPSKEEALAARDKFLLDNPDNELQRRSRLPANDRFWFSVDKSGDCWEWTANCHDFGYGLFKVDGKTVGTHRYSYELHNGRIPDGLHVLHRCDNPKCVRPDHLFLGTQADNMEDKVTKGRHATGKDHGQARLSIREVLAIREIIRRFPPTRKRLEPGWGVCGFLARWFGVDSGTVLLIAQSKTWRKT